MDIFSRQTPFQKERTQLQKQEQAFLAARTEKEDSAFNRKLAEVIPPTLQGTLDTAFFKAFQLIFEKGTGIIERTYSRKRMEQEAQENHAHYRKSRSKASIRAVTRRAGAVGNTGLLLSGASGLGMGILGIGLPDIPLFTATTLRTVYEIALAYGCQYDTPEERYLILLLIQGSVSYGDNLRQIDQEINRFLQERTLPEDYSQEVQIRRTAGALSKELLYMKFLQGIPLVGVVGGFYDVVYMKQIAAYAKLKYKRRFLFPGETGR